MLFNKNIYKDKSFIKWISQWKKRSTINNSVKENQIELMRKNNPIVIPRNYKIEDVLTAANMGNLYDLNKILSILNNPYEVQKMITDYQKPAPISDEKYKTFCGT